jgi:hypothetical protein
MIRHLSAIALVLGLSPVPLYAQTAHITVTSSIANVHKSPSTGAPVIGNAPIGSSYTITRELGSWVRISWPAAEDGAGYLHVSWGRISDGPIPVSNQLAAGPRTTSIAARTSSTSTTSTAGRAAMSTPSTTNIQGDSAADVQQAVSSTAQSINSLQSTAPAGTPTSHLFGIGGRMGSTAGFGASARAAITDHVGVQVEISRYAPSSVIAPEKLSSVQVAPSVMFSLPDKLTDYVWVRPYLGAGLSMYRSTMNSGIPGDASVSENGLGRQVFGGTALSFAAAPRFSLSFDYGYRWNQPPVAGVELDGPGLSVSGHWYVK